MTPGAAATSTAVGRDHTIGCWSQPQPDPWGTCLPNATRGVPWLRPRFLLSSPSRRSARCRSPSACGSIRRHGRSDNRIRRCPPQEAEPTLQPGRTAAGVMTSPRHQASTSQTATDNAATVRTREFICAGGVERQAMGMVFRLRRSAEAHVEKSFPVSLAVWREMGDVAPEVCCQSCPGSRCASGAESGNQVPARKSTPYRRRTAPDREAVYHRVRPGSGHHGRASPTLALLGDAVAGGPRPRHSMRAAGPDGRHGGHLSLPTRTFVASCPRSSPCALGRSAPGMEGISNAMPGQVPGGPHREADS